MPTDRPVVFESLKMTRTKHLIDGRLKDDNSYFLTVPKLYRIQALDIARLDPNQDTS